MRRPEATAVLLLLALTSAFAGDWQALDQPDLKAQLDAAQPLEVESLGAPVKTTRVGETMLVPNPDGKTYDVLQWYFKGYSGPTTCFISDLGTGFFKKDGIPDRRQIHICGRVLGPDGKFYIATPKWDEGMELYVYDPAANELTCRGVIAPGLTGERRPMVVGTDGMIYGSGSYYDSGKAGAYKLDPWTGEVTDYGPIGPSHKPNGIWGYYCAADDEWIYVASGKVPWYLVAYNHKTGEEKVLVETERLGGSMSVRQRWDGCTARATRVKGQGEEPIEYWLYKGEAIVKTDDNPPWPAREKPADTLPPKPELYRERLDPDPDGHAELWYRTPEAKAAAPENPPEDATPEQLGWQVVNYKVDIFPALIRRLVEMPDGRLIGTADFYLGNFLVDPATGETEHPGKIPLSHYSTTFYDGKVYMSGYPSSPIYVYDPSRPWTVGKGTLTAPAPSVTDPASNPRRLTYLNQWSRTHKMYGAAVGADGKVYFGGILIRNGHGGGLGWWDPHKDEGGGIWEPFTAYQIHFLCAANEGRELVISTKAVRDDKDDSYTPEQGKLFVWDVAQAKIIREIEPVPKAKDTGAVLEVRPGLVLGATADPQVEGGGLLYGVDIGTGEVLFRKQVPYDFRFDSGRNRNGLNDYRLGPDGMVWTYVGDMLVRIDPSDVRVAVVGKIAPPGRIAFADDDIYLAGTTELRRIREIVPR